MAHLGVRWTVDDSAEAVGSTKLRGRQLLSANSALGGMKSGAPALSAGVGDKIGKQLREVYDSVVREPLPDRFSELLNGLEYARD